MIPFYATDSRIHAAVGSVAASGAAVLRSWSAFEAEAAASDIAIVAIDDSRLDEHLARVEWLTSHHGTRVVLVLADALCDDPLLGFSAASVIPLSELGSKLPAGIDAARSLVWRRQVATCFSRAQQVPFLIRIAIRSACQDFPRAAQSVSSVAHSIGTNPATIAHVWRSFHPASLRFQDILAWIRLDWALLYCRRVKHWSEAARQIGVSERTLRRLAVRCAGVSLNHLRYHGRRELHQLFDRLVMVPIIGSSVGVED